MATATLDESKRIEYPISSGYVRDWSVVDALRELIANMLDEHTKGVEYRCRYDAGRAIFEDFGEGFRLRHLMLGEGEEKGSSQIGTFREGMKLALLVLAREGREVVLEGARCSVCRVEFEDIGLDAPGLILHVGEGRDEPGTRAEVECTEEEFDEACGRFVTLEVEGKPKPRIPDREGVFVPEEGVGSGTIYINGLQVGPTDLAFSYTLKGKDVKRTMNRDRTVLDTQDVFNRVKELWRSAEVSDRLRKILLRHSMEGGDVPELETRSRYLRFRSRTRWRGILEDLFGTDKLYRVRGMSQSTPARELERLGYVEASEDGAGKVFWAVVEAAVEEAPEVLSRHYRKHSSGDFGPLVEYPLESLSQRNLNKYQKAASMVASVLCLSRATGYISRSIDCKSLGWRAFNHNRADDSSAGVFRYDTIWLKRDYLDRHTIPSITGVLFHELAHAITGATDETREFDKGLELICSTALKHDPEALLELNLLEDPGCKGFICHKLPTAGEVDLIGAIRKLSDKGLEIDKSGGSRYWERAESLEWELQGLVLSDGYNREGGYFIEPVDHPNQRGHLLYVAQAPMGGAYTCHVREVIGGVELSVSRSRWRGTLGNLRYAIMAASCGVRADRQRDLLEKTVENRELLPG